MTATSSKGHILCIDDDAQFRTEVADELGHAGYSVDAAGKAATATALARIRQPDLILCDISMPGADGYEVLAHLREPGNPLSPVPFIFLTGLAGREDIIRGKLAGADDYLAKPVDYELMVATIEARIGQIRRLGGTFGEFDLRRQSMAVAGVGEMSGAVSTPALDRLGIGLILLSNDGLILRTNEIADELFTQADGLRRHGDRLRTAASRANYALQSAIANAEGTFVVVPRDLRQSLLLHVSRAIGGTLIAVLDPERAPELSEVAAAALYGLTPTEARVSIAVASGKRPDEIIAELGIAQSTINFHLNNVFRKTGTCRQIDLAALLIRTAIAP